jgi:transposase
MPMALAKTQSVIGVEDRSVRGMVRNRHLSRSITDAGWSEFRRTLASKKNRRVKPAATKPESPSRKLAARAAVNKRR